MCIFRFSNISIKDYSTLYNYLFNTRCQKQSSNQIIHFIIKCIKLGKWSHVCLFDGVYCHFQQCFSYIVVVSFIGGGHRRTTDKLYHIMLYTLPWSRFELTTSVMIGIDCIGSCKSDYHTITATTATWTVMYLWVKCIDFASFYDFSIRF